MRAAMLKEFWEQVRPTSSYQRFLYWTGAVLVTSGLLHVGMLVADAGPWYGPLSWRKPVVFGLSFGVTAWGLGWVLGRQRVGRWRGWIVAGAFGAGSLVEVGLITMQRWRGVPSHFNTATPFDEAVFSAMGTSVLVVAVAVAAALVWALLGLRRDPVGWWASVTGLVLILAASRIGMDMIAQGVATVEATGQVPSSVMFGPAGSAKLAHGVGMHGIQVLGGLAVVLGLGRLPEDRRRWLMRGASVAYAALFAVVSAQAYAGRALLDMPAPAATVVVAASAALAWVGLSAARSWIEARRTGAAA